ncbi:MAG TPA: alpha/beta fold hydrolase [Oscillospiraceae bacterium]|nr:alpha/beta fold hydrolase [Oscillospiraceae bacterium]HPF55283.1 alpha/beta fold hydrolase [Clostridiales bacterium]HPK34687.1 alpha/beta fold hydrolase [Oscillospiraceae bacterium]HPR74549.1 alpha/beta fold hydrolase [Oscillospiraceae bacterium]
MKYTKEKFECGRDALKIRGYLLKPTLSGKMPAVIVSHGFASNTHDTKKYAECFAEAGYAAVYFDFCGSGRSKSDGKSTDMSVLTEKADLSAVLDALRSLDFIDHSKIILAGCSQGGLVSALLAAERESDVDKLILYYPALCIPDDARRGKMLNSKFDPENVPQTFRALFVKLGAKFATDAQKLDPFKEICTFAKPVLICHGTADRLVNISYAQKAAKEYPNAKLVIVENGDHGFLFHGFKEAMRATMQFLNEDDHTKL